MSRRSSLLAASIDGQRKNKKPVRPGVDPVSVNRGGARSADQMGAHVGGRAPQPVRPGMNPAPRLPGTATGGDQATGAQRGRKGPGRSQGPDAAAALGMKRRDPTR